MAPSIDPLANTANMAAENMIMLPRNSNLTPSHLKIDNKK
jgi:hypothetical protein